MLLAFNFPATAQQPKKVSRIGFLTTGAAGRYPFAETFRQGLRELGYVDWKNILIEYRHAEGRSERLPELAEELVRLKVDVIVTTATEPSLAAQRATTTVPIVMVGGGDPVGAGLVSSLARPGGNITGVTTTSVDLSGKRLELLKEVAPKISLVAVLWIPTAAGNKLQMKETDAAANSFRLHLQPVGVQGPDDFENAFSAINRGSANSLILLSSPMFASHRARIADLAAKTRLPAIYPVGDYVEAGGLMSYGNNISEVYRRAAVYVEKILKGTKPTDVPVERPMKFEFVVNLKTAKQIGLTIPPNVLARADKIIK
jgi:putative ABC transport system substrate-binding protein